MSEDALSKEIENKLDGIAWAVGYAKKALINEDMHRVRLAFSIMQNVCEVIVGKIEEKIEIPS